MAERIGQVDRESLANELSVGLLTLNDILTQLVRPGRDPREDLPAPVFKRGVIKLEDLAAGMELTGTVLNVVDFGCFVDIGMHDSGLVHVSRLADKYVRDPHDVVAVGDIVKVWVVEIDKERRRVSLTMVKPGSERPKYPQRGGRPSARQAGRRRPREASMAVGSVRRVRPANSVRRVRASSRASSVRRGPRVKQRPPRPEGDNVRRVRRRRPSAKAARPRSAAVRAASSDPAAASGAEAGDSDHRRHEERQGAAADVQRPDAILSAQDGRSNRRSSRQPLRPTPSRQWPLSPQRFKRHCRL